MRKVAQHLFGFGRKSMELAPARALAAALEPVTGQVYFSPECHADYEKLGFCASPGKMGEVALPDGPAYFTQPRLGDGPGAGRARRRRLRRVQPGRRRARRRPRLDAHRRRHDLRRPHRRRRRPAACASSATSPTASTAPPSCCERANDGLRPEGRPLFAGLLSLGLPGDPIGDVWRLGRPAPRVPRRRPHRGVDQRRVRRHRDRAAVASSTGACRCAPTCGRGRGATSSSTPPRRGSARAGSSPTAPSPTQGRAEREAVEDATDHAVPADRRHPRRRPRRARRHPLDVVDGGPGRRRLPRLRPPRPRRPRRS